MERRLDTWLETGHQLVDGVSGRRPGQRRTSLDLDSMGRWVGEKVDWLLDDDDDWREPWQEQTSPEASSRGGKRPLQAVSRRRPPAADDSWPEDILLAAKLFKMKKLKSFTHLTVNLFLPSSSLSLLRHCSI